MNLNQGHGAVALSIANRLRENGYLAYFAGGCVLDYLMKNYGIGGTNALSTTNQPTQATQTTSSDALKIVTKYGCLGCHTISAKLVGPPYREVATKYNSDSQASEKVEGQIQKGGSGKWGPVIMPPFPQVSDAERKTLADWILNQK